MKHLRALVVFIALIFAFPDEAMAVFPDLSGPAPELTSSEDDASRVSRRRKKRRRARRKRGKKKRRVDSAVAPAEGSDESGDGKDGNWGSSDWASPTWASGEGKPGEEEQQAEQAQVEEAVEPASSYKKAPGIGGAFLLLRPSYTGANRNYAYDNSTSGNLRNYEASFVSLIGISLEAYPGVLLEIEKLDAIGLRVGYSQALGLKSAPRADNSTEYTTTWNEIDIGATGRFVLKETVITAGLSYGMLNFALDVPSDDPLSGQVQNLGYKYIRAGIDFRYSVKAFSLLAGGGYRHVLSTGELGDDVFPDSSALGFDANAGLAYQIFDPIEIFAAFKFTQFIHSLTANAQYAADGATDRYLAGEAGLLVFF